MKKLFIVAFFIFSTFSFLKAQSLSNDNSEILTFAEQMPEYPNGMDSVMRFIQKNLSYPGKAKKDSIQGKVIVQFVVSKTGAIEDIKIIKSLSKECDEEVMRVVSIMPRWNPGKQNGKAVSVRFVLPVIFRLKD